MITAGWPGQGGAQRPGRRVGVEREQDERVRLGGVGGVHARVGAHEAVAGAADQPPVVRADELARSRTARPRRGAGPCSCSRASASARAPGVTSAQADRPALGLADDLVGDDEHVGRLVSSTPAAAPSRRREIVTRRGPRAGRAAPGARSSDRRLARAARACAGPMPASARRSAARSSGVSMSSPRLGTSTTRNVAPAARGERGVAGERALAERRAPSRPAASAAARWCPGRGGRGRSPPARCGPAGRLTSPASSDGQSPGTSSTRSAPRERRRDAQRARPPTGRPPRGRGPRGRPRGAPARRRPVRR